MYFESSKLAVVRHEYGSQDSNNVETKVKLSSMHRETVASTMRVNLASSKAAAAAAAAAAIQCQHVREQSPTAEKKSAFETELGLQFLDDRREEDINRDSLIFE